MRYHGVSTFKIFDTNMGGCDPYSDLKKKIEGGKVSLSKYRKKNEGP